jgi:uncharacterized protein (TIGR02145 family)/uncharacterized repeat protein (TIGR02543 family)
MKKLTLPIIITFLCMAVTAQNAPSQLLPKVPTEPTKSSDVQVINIPQGWSSISGYVLPEETDIELLFQSTIQQLIIVQNLQGVYYPDDQLNTLENWDAATGYMVKFSGPATFELAGDMIADKTLNLATGWNLIPVISECPVNVVTLFADIDLAIVKEVAGIKLYWPAMDISTLQDLLPGKAYFVFMNSPGAITFLDCDWECGDPLIDARDGQSYETVQIGSQCWMAENLNIGTRINGGINQSNNGIIEKYCYNNSEAQCDIYGGLYQWSEMMGHVTVAGVTGICPEGWHIPTDDEWCILEQEVDPTITCNSTGWRGIDGGGKLKKEGSPWFLPNVGATNSSGFTALPGGIGATGGTFAQSGYFGFWWSSSQFDANTAWQRDLYYEVAQIRRIAASSNKLSGYSVRCLKDEIPIQPYYNLNLLIDPSDAGTVTGAGQYEPGEVISVTATANPGWQFVNWTDDDEIVSNVPEFSYTMPLQDVTLTANFEEEQAGFNCGEPLIDARDGKSYATVQLGDQCWMAESLNYGTMITGNQAMADNGIVEKYCYNNDEANCTIYGALYQWNELMQYTTTPGVQGICPEGWHVPTDAEWTALTSYVSSQPEYLCNNNTNYIAKALASTTLWYNSTTSCSIGRTLSANNATGFTGLPAGFRASNGSFNNLNGSLDFWSSTEQLSTTAMRRYLYFSYRDVAANPTEKTKGASVRCVRY